MAPIPQLDRVSITPPVTPAGEGDGEVNATTVLLRSPDAPSEVRSAATRILANRSKSLTNNPAVLEEFSRANGAHGEELPGFDAWLSRTHRVPMEDSAAARDRIIELFSGELVAAKALLEGELPKAEKSALKSYARAYEVALRVLEKADPKNDAETSTAVRTAKEVLYTTMAKQVRDMVGSRRNIGGALSVGRRYVAQSTYRLAWEDPQTVIGRGSGATEAKNLVSPADPRRFVTAAELDALTPSQIAALDISENHPVWHTETTRRAHPNRYAELEGWLNAAVTKELKSAGVDTKYDLHRASKVVFFDDLRDAATSPKILVADAFGNEMGLKWGEEAAIEPVCNRVLIKLGLKFTDLANNHVGADSPKLILAKPGKGPSTVDEFVVAMKSSAYDFNAKPHIQSATVITASNVDDVMKDLHPGHAITREELIGRTVVTFRESMTEAKHDVLGRAGPMPLHSTSNKQDRVHRGMQLAYLWLKLGDNKEDNHRYSFLKGFDGEKGRTPVAFVHDSGSGLGGKTSSGELNELHVDGQFLRHSIVGNDLVSSEFQLYRSTAWDQETMADMLWMANKIVTITQADLRECAAASEWPDYARDVMVWRLAKRRDIIAKEFGLTVKDPAGPPPTIEIDLSTRAAREAAAQRFSIPLEELETRMREAKILDKPFKDLVVKEGVLREADDTILTGLLTDLHHPAGIESRTTRRQDGEEYVSRRFNGRGWFD